MEKLHDKSQGGYKPIPVCCGTAATSRPKPDDNWPYQIHPQNGFDPQYGIRNPKFERHLFIRRDQIFYDIDAQINMISESRRKEDGTEDNTFTDATTKYQQLFYRWIDKYLGKAKSVMSAFVLEIARSTKMNSISQEEEMDIVLLFPEWYDDTVFEQLCDAVHDYVVNAALYEFFALTLSAKDPVTVTKQEQLNDSLNDVRKYVNAAKPGRVRKPYNPF